MEYIIYKMIEVSKLNSGGDRPKIYSDTKTNECCFPIFSNGLQDEGLYGYTNKATMPSDTITVSARGANIGEVFYRKEDFLPIVRLITIIPDSNYVHSKYLYYYLKKVKIEGSGSAQPQITIPFFSRHKIVIPKDVEYQKKVADILSTYDNLIENNNERIKLLEQMAEKLYKEWFVRFRFPGYKNEHFIEDIPSSWRYVQLGDIASFDRGISYSSDEINCDDGINLINLKNIQSYGGFRRDGTKQYNGKYKDSQIVIAGDLILGVTDMTQDRRTVGSVALIPQISGSSVISADLVKVKLKVPNVFFYCMCRYGFYSKYFSQFANGANVLHLKPKVLLNKKILLPTAELIEAFVEKVQPMIDIVDDLNCQNDLLTKQRDMLLPRLMSGKLEV